MAVPLNPLLTLAEVQVDRFPLRGVHSGDGPRDVRRHYRIPDTLVSGTGSRRRRSAPGRVPAPHSRLAQAPPAPPARGPTETVAVFHSSGTEGSPKRAALSSHALLAGRAMALLSAPLVGRGAMALLALPWAHIMAVSTAIYGLLAGVPAYLLRRFDVAGRYRRHRAQPGDDVVVGVPAMFIRLVNAAPEPNRSRASGCGSRPATTCPAPIAGAC